MSKYKYINFQGRYLCLQQNPFVLGWWLYFQKRPLPSFIDKKKLLKLLQYQLYSQLQLKRENTFLELPVYGTFCLSVRGGYKVFDVQKETVTKIFTSEVDTDTIAREIERLRKIGIHGFAPSILRWNIKERWYEEDYVSGVSGYSLAPSDSTSFMRVYSKVVAPCIEKLILTEPPQATDLREYVSKITDAFNEAILLRQEYGTEQVNKISNFVYSMVKHLRIEKNFQIYLVFSHGDFHQFNVFRTRQGIKMIDWEGFGHQSVLFDLYNYFFSQLYLKNTTTDLILEINEAVSSLHSSLVLKSPKIADNFFSLNRLYRWLYYVERICSFVDKFELPQDKVIRWVVEFDRFEKNNDQYPPLKERGIDCHSEKKFNI